MAKGNWVGKRVRKRKRMWGRYVREGQERAREDKRREKEEEEQEDKEGKKNDEGLMYKAKVNVTSRDGGRL